VTQQADIARLLPLPVPPIADEQLLLFIVRRLAAHGLHDAHAANAMLCSFGLSYRRPLMLLRAFMLELARASRRSITVAPCCAARMTLDEGRIMAALTQAGSDRACAMHHLREVTADADAHPALSAAMALFDAMSDLGRPLVR
jgi:hypothetical protein